MANETTDIGIINVKSKDYNVADIPARKDIYKNTQKIDTLDTSLAVLNDKFDAISVDDTTLKIS